MNKCFSFFRNGTKYSGRDGIRQITKTLFLLWSLVKENAQINRITRHREEHGLKKNCNHLEVVDGNETVKTLLCNKQLTLLSH